MEYVMRSFDGTFYYVWTTTTEPKTGVMLPPWQDAGLIQMQKYATKKEADKGARNILKNHAAATLGRLGGSAKSEAKAASSRANGAKGGRPKKVKDII